MITTNFQDDVFDGTRKYRQTTNADGTISLEDVTEYLVEGTPITSGVFNSFKNEINNATRVVNVTLGTTWVQDTTNKYYTQDVTCDGITSTSVPTLDVLLSGSMDDMDADMEEWNKVVKATTSLNTITFYANEPTSKSITIVVRGA